MVDFNPILVQVVENESCGQWKPIVGPETCEFLARVVPEDSRDAILEAAINILAKGVPATSDSGQETGLVVGYVQSGKTLSFETVIALARDNAFEVIIVIAGTSNPLLAQSSGRLRRDLSLDDTRRGRRWIPLTNPSPDDPTLQAIRDVLDEWNDTGIPLQHKRTVLITVLKHHHRLNNLTQLLNRLEMQGVPVLIIDDEADQASLNNEAQQGQVSTTYRCLMELKDVLPNHTYVQYTATPQAPLLINIIDSLSPNFVQVLEAGSAYVGGQDFFSEDLSYVRIIPPQDIPDRDSPLIEVPQSLLEALRVFMIGVTVGIVKDSNMGNRSMMVHPSRGRDLHQEYFAKVHDVFEEWKRILKLSDTEPDKQELFEDFRSAYEDLYMTVGADLPTFDQILPSLLHAFRNTRIMEVNARTGNTPEIDWCSSYGWILVGGQAMDRGFTVEGLTVTYMPRGTGMGNADTIQQRARFFGYKRHYLGYCRIYLEEGTISAYQSYVEHEEDIRSQLQDFASNNRPLNEWKRAFVLDAALRPCRHNVLEFDYMRGRFSNSWVKPSFLLVSEQVLHTNQQVVDRFVRSLTFHNDTGHKDRTPIQRHQICRDVLLREVIDDLLIDIRITGSSDSQHNTGLLIQLSSAVDNNSNETCTIICMSPERRRQRTIRQNGEIPELFQGAAPVEPRERRGEVYPGDNFIRDDDNVTVQIHTLDLLDEGGGVVVEGVPVLAVWVPARLARGWVVQG